MSPSDQYPAQRAAKALRNGKVSAEVIHKLAELLETIDVCLAADLPVPVEIRDLFTAAVRAHESARRDA